MKNCKKLIALCLALATIFSFTVFASAAGTDISASGDSASASVNLSSTVDGDLILCCGVAEEAVTLSNVNVNGRLVVWGGGTDAVFCNDGTNIPEVLVCRVDNAVKVIYERNSTLAVYDDCGLMVVLWV